jgi:predicted flavoprotein YhiN
MFNRSTVQVKLNTSVEEILRHPYGFEGRCQDGRRYHGKKIILATGGKAAPQLGSEGDFYTWLSSQGHKIYPLLPALTPLKLEAASLKKISGIRFQAKGTLITQKNMSAERVGEFLWTNYGFLNSYDCVEPLCCNSFTSETDEKLNLSLIF